VSDNTQVISGKDIQVVKPGAGLATPATARLMDLIAALPDSSIEDIIERTLARTLAATTAEDILADPDGTGLGELLDVPIIIQSGGGKIPRQ
jgi:hypothetical protein